MTGNPFIPDNKAYTQISITWKGGSKPSEDKHGSNIQYFSHLFLKLTRNLFCFCKKRERSNQEGVVNTIWEQEIKSKTDRGIKGQPDRWEEMMEGLGKYNFKIMEFVTHVKNFVHLEFEDIIIC